MMSWGWVGVGVWDGCVLGMYMGCLYAESLVNMDHIFDAIQHLSPDTVMDVSVLPPQEPTGQGVLGMGGCQWVGWGGVECVRRWE